MSHLLKFRSSIAVLAMVAALFLVGVQGWQAGPAASAQSTVTLLSNFSVAPATGTGAAQIVAVGTVSAVKYQKAASFKTGSNPAGYNLEQLTFKIHPLTGTVPDVNIHANDPDVSGAPGMWRSF